MIVGSFQRSNLLQRRIEQARHRSSGIIRVPKGGAGADSYPWKLSVNGDEEIEVNEGVFKWWKQIDPATDADGGEWQVYTLDTSNLGTVAIPESGSLYVYINFTLDNNMAISSCTLSSNATDPTASATQSHQYIVLGTVSSASVCYNFKRENIEIFRA